MDQVLDDSIFAPLREHPELGVADAGVVLSNLALLDSAHGLLNVGDLLRQRSETLDENAYSIQ